MAAALGAGASAGVTACGEDRGSVTIEGGATGTEGTATSTVPTTTAPTETQTTPRTETTR